MALIIEERWNSTLMRYNGTNNLFEGKLDKVDLLRQPTVMYRDRVRLTPTSGHAHLRSCPLGGGQCFRPVLLYSLPLGIVIIYKQIELETCAWSQMKRLSKAFLIFL